MSVDKFGRYIHEKQNSNNLKLYEKTVSGLYLDTDGNFSIQQRPIHNGGFPKENADFVIKEYVDTAISQLRESLSTLNIKYQEEIGQSFDGLEAIDVDTSGNFNIQRVKNGNNQKESNDKASKDYVDESVKRLRDGIISHRNELILSMPDIKTADIEHRIDRLEEVVSSIIEKIKLSR